jgi:membrane associated rhomboid family serine protease
VNQTREPLFNVPPVVLATLALLCLVHAVRMFMFTPDEDFEFLIRFAFIPVRYDSSVLLGGILPGGIGADIWTFFSYALIHGNLMHLGFNAVWLLAFGSPLAWRFGEARFIAFFAVTAAAGAVAHLVTHLGEFLPMIGASAAISGTMAGSIRFAFQHGGPLGPGRRGRDAYLVPTRGLLDALRDPKILIFIAVWFGVNLIFGLGAISLMGAQQAVAWEAHVGGFVAGLFLFGLFDPVAPGGARPHSDTMS